jgi:autotransporter-associated beta strand protein
MSQLLCILVTIASAVFFAICDAAADGFDWRNVNGQNWNSPVKNQNGGTCWVFSGVGSFEARYKLTRNDPVYSFDCSEQQVEWDCGPSTWGGWGDGSVFYSVTHGLVSETECPIDPNSAYWEVPGPTSLWPLATGWQNRMLIGADTSVADREHVGGAHQVCTTNFTKLDIQNALKMYGPMMTAVLSTNDLYDSVAQLKANYRAPTAGVDHAVVLVGYQDDASIPSGGYWVIKNSWGPSAADKGYYYVPYGDLEYHSDIVAINTPVYYTGAMAAATWKGGVTAWSNGGNNWTNNATGNAYAWENKETVATFGGTGGAVAVSGTVITHGLTINSTGYSFSGGALTITAGGIAANESAAFSSSVYVGAPQSWNVAAGKTLTVSGALHTIISDLTLSGAGNTVISGTIDGGGVLNTYGGAKPGGLIEKGSGTLTLTGAANFGGDITVQAGSGGLTIAPVGGASAIYSGAILGGGSITVNSTGTVSIGGGGSNFSGPISLQGNGTLAFVPTSGTTGTFSGAISGNSAILHSGEGTTILSGTNSYSGSTMINNGALQADLGKGIPTSSPLVLNGGVYQNNTGTTFTLNIGTTGNTVQWAAGGGGFAAGANALAVNIGNNATPSTLDWGSSPDDIGSKIVGTLKFGSSTSTKVVTFRNPINLNGADRTIDVENNSASTSDYAEMSGSISGSAGIIKTGDGLLSLTGSNSYTGTTTISGGQLQTNLTTGILPSSFICLDGGVLQGSFTSFTRSLGTSGGTFQWTVNGGGFASTNSLTVNINNNGGTLTFGPTPGTNIMGKLILGSPTAKGNVTFLNGLDLGGGAQTVQVDCNNATFSSPIVGTGSLTKSGTGTLILSGSAGNTYSGSTTILGGNLTLNKTAGYAIPGDLILGGNTSSLVTLSKNDQLSPTANILWQGTGGNQVLKLYGHTQTVASISDSTGYGIIENTASESNVSLATLTVNNSTDCFYNGRIRDNASGNGRLALVKTGSGTLTLSGGAINWWGGTTVSGGKLVLQDTNDGGFDSRNIGLANNATLEIDAKSSSFNFSGVISGAGAVNFAGSNKLTLNGSSGNTYTGNTNVVNGTVILAKTSGYAIPGNLTITDGSAFVIAQNANQFPASTVLTMAGGWDAHFELYGNTVTVAGLVSTGTGGAIENTESETDIGNSTLIVNNTAACTYSAAIRNNWGGSGTVALVKDGAGTLTLKGSRTGDYTGGLTVKNGTLDYSSGYLPNCNYTITGGTLKIPSVTKSIGTFQITGGTISGSGLLTSNAAYDIQGGTVAARLGGTFPLNKTGAGTATLSGYNSYSGGTTISAGTLVASTAYSLGAMGNSVTIQSGAQLQLGATLPLQSNAVLTNQGTISGSISLTGGAKAQGNGVYGPVSVLTGGVFSPGTGIGSAVSGTTAWTANGKYLFEINDALGVAGSNWDLWNISGNLAISGSSPFTVALSSVNAANQSAPIADFDPTASCSWLIASATGTISGFSSNAVQLDTSLFRNDLSQGKFSLSESVDSKQLYLNYIPNVVPEPGTLLLLTLGTAIGSLGYFRRKMPRQSSRNS